MLSAKQDPATFELEDDAAQSLQLSAIALSAVVVNGDHAAIAAFEHVQQVGPERAARLAEIAAELREDRFAADTVAGKGREPWRVPRGGLVEQL